ncbi:hypothetical protein P4S70_25665 [Enterovibrio sp. Hal110]
MPTRNTTNATLGVLRCECGDVKTVHKAKGNRKGSLYTICDQCGTDQRNGATVQAKWAKHVASVEDLTAAEAEPVTDEAAPPAASSAIVEADPIPTPPPLAKPKGTVTREPLTHEPKPDTGSAWPIIRGVLLGALFGGLAARF